MVADLLEESRAPPTGCRACRARPRVLLGPAGRPVRRGLLPEPARPAPGAVRVRLVTGRPAAPAAADLGLEHELLDVAWRAARAAGDLLMAGREQALTVTTKSTLTDVVTQMDTEAEALVVGTILAARPDDGLLGEEGADRAGSTGVRWIVDPLDGTVNYLYGLPSWAVSIAAEVDGVVEVGVVDVPRLRRDLRRGPRPGRRPGRGRAGRADRPRGARGPQPGPGRHRVRLRRRRGGPPRRGR